jgi:hypothetical protein
MFCKGLRSFFSERKGGSYINNVNVLSTNGSMNNIKAKGGQRTEHENWK